MLGSPEILKLIKKGKIGPLLRQDKGYEVVEQNFGGTDYERIFFLLAEYNNKKLINKVNIKKEIKLAFNALVKSGDINRAVNLIYAAHTTRDSLGIKLNYFRDLAKTIRGYRRVSNDRRIDRILSGTADHE